MKKVGLVLEGGSMRGLFTSGVLDTFLENSIEVDGIVAVSAGALFGVNYLSKQKGRGLRYNKKYIGDKRYISLHSLITTGNLINKDFTFYKIAKELDPIDNETFKNSNKDFYITATNVETGLPEYIKITDPIEQLEAFRATSAIPFASEIIEIDNKQVKMVEIKYHKYKRFINAMKQRYIKYNNTLEKIIDLENKKEIFVIRPSQKINLNILVNNPEKIQEVYDLGVNDCQKILSSLKEYLNK